MSLLLHVLLFCKVMKAKSQRSFLIHREIKFYLRVLTKRQDYGMYKLEKIYRLWRDTKIKSSHVCSTIKGTLSLRVPKITHAKFGGTLTLSPMNEKDPKGLIR